MLCGVLGCALKSIHMSKSVSGLAPEFCMILIIQFMYFPVLLLIFSFFCVFPWVFERTSGRMCLSIWHHTNPDILHHLPICLLSAHTLTHKHKLHLLKKSSKFFPGIYINFRNTKTHNVSPGRNSRNHLV